MFCLSVLLLNSMSKLIHNRCSCKLIIKTLPLHMCMQTNNIACLFLCFNPLFSVVQFWNYTKTIIPFGRREYCRIIPKTKSRGLFDNIHFAVGEQLLNINHRLLPIDKWQSITIANPQNNLFITCYWLVKINNIR